MYKDAKGLDAGDLGQLVNVEGFAVNGDAGVGVLTGVRHFMYDKGGKPAVRTLVTLRVAGERWVVSNYVPGDAGVAVGPSAT